MSDPSTPEPGQYGATPPPPQYGEQPAAPQTPPPSYGEQAAAGQQPSYGPPPGYGPGPGYGQVPPTPVPPAGYQYAVPDDPGAQNSMVLGIIGLALGMFCGFGFLASPFALVMGLKSMRRIDAAGGKLGGRGNAQAGFIMGIVGTVLLALAVLAAILLIVLLVVSWEGSTIVINDGVPA